MAIHLKGANGITALSIDTDGIDGVEDNAGAFICRSNSKKRKIDKILQPQRFLDNNDSYSFFEKIDDLIFTKPTLTNVNDFRAVSNSTIKLYLLKQVLYLKNQEVCELYLGTKL